MLPDDPVARAESKPDTLADWFRGVERLKNAARLFKPRPRIHKRDFYMFLLRPQSDPKRPGLAALHGVDGIRDDMQKYLNQLIGVSLDQRYLSQFLNLYVHVVPPPS